LQARDLQLAYGDNVVVHDLDLDVLDGTVTAVIGPNGCGKSTLLRALGRLLPTRSGYVLLDGKRIDRTPTREVARVLGVLPQSPIAPEGLTVLLLDEPTTYLDLAHQVDVLDLVERLNREMGRTVVMVLHDLNLAACYAGRLVAMRAGRIVASGSPAEVLTEDLLSDVFGLGERVAPDPVAGTPLVVPVGLRSRVDPVRQP
jgi:ABC-type cobalamin/Fe3+-siderophores transport system ATPase subunit